MDAAFGVPALHTGRRAEIEPAVGIPLLNARPPTGIQQSRTLGLMLLGSTVPGSRTAETFLDVLALQFRRR
jgi:hypothetical protein